MRNLEEDRPETMIGKTISHYKILEKLPSTGLRTSGEGGIPTDRNPAGKEGTML